MTLDILFTHAKVIDGTGAPWYNGSIGLRDGQIEHLSPAPEPELSADTALKIDGLAIAPGFIDAHSHSDLAPFRDHTLEPKARQGITTEVVGQDGLSMAPIRSEKFDEWTRYLRPIVGSVADSNSTWSSTTEYFDAIDAAGSALNLAMLVGHGTVRYDVLGMTDRQPTEEELVEMEALVSRALSAGAAGFSTGLVYSPQVHAETEELRRLASQLGPTGRPFVAHIRSYDQEMWTALDEFVDIGAREDIPVHLSHFKLSGPKRGLHDRANELVRAARDRGVDFTADLYPYVPGNTMLQTILPEWVHIGGPDSILERLEKQDVRDRIKRDMLTNGGSGNVLWENIQISNVNTEENELYLGRTIQEIATEEGIDPFEFMFDLLVEEDLDVAYVNLKFGEQAEDDIRSILANELVAIGSDAIFGKHPHPRLYGTYPRMLGRYARDLHLVSLEEAIRKMTSLPARIYGFGDKGIIRTGMDADLVVFDPRTIGSSATFNDPCRYPTGIEHVLVDGEFIVKDGEITGTTPGRVLRL